MSTKTTLMIGMAVVALAIGANQALAPKTPDEIRRQQQEQSIQDLSDSKDRSNDDMRDQGNDHQNAENRRRNTPGEVKPKIRLRWLP